MVLILEKLGGRSAGSSGRADADQGDPYVLKCLRRCADA